MTELQEIMRQIFKLEDQKILMNDVFRFLFTPIDSVNQVSILIL